MKPGDQVEPTPPASGTALPPGGTDPVAEAPEGAVVAAAATPATQGSDRIPVPGAAPAPVGDEAPPGPGASLAHARQALGWSVVEVARQLKLHPRQVEALEKDAFDRLRSPIYVRGFARNYARLVGADVPALMRALDERCPMPALVPPDPLLDIGVGATLPSADRPSRRYVRIALGVVLAVAIVAVVDRIWSPFSSEQAVAPAAVTTPVEPSPLLGAGAEQPAGPEAPAASGGSISPVPATGESPPAAAPAPQSQTPAARTVRLAFERESWVEIRDASGQVILSGVNRAGTEQVVKGLAPLAVVVGNAGGVRVDYEARRVDLQPHTLVNVARLTLD